MALDLGSARHWARSLQEQALFSGAKAIDATMGNGGDTEALCRMVGPDGHVYAFDVQADAVENTRARLVAGGLIERASLMLIGHERMAEYVPANVDLAVFNLGWLPGSSDKSHTTNTLTTLQALDAAMTLLKPGGAITVCAYPGHEEGARELAAVIDWAKALSARDAQSLVHGYLNQNPCAPVLIAVTKALKSK